MKKIVTICFTLFFSQLVAQENQGEVHDNFNPVNGQYINPSNIVDSKVWLDFNLIEASAYGRNNLVYFPNTNWLDFGSLENDPLVKTDLRNIRLYGDFDMRGPSISLNMGRHAVSVFTGMRGIVNVNRLPGQLAKYAVNETLETSDIGTYNINNARLKSMVWGEIGLTYGMMLYARGDNMWTGALTVKHLIGIQQANLLFDNSVVEVRDVQDVALLSTNGKFSFTEGGMNSGRGWGINLGATYKKMKENVDNYIPHSKRTGCEHRDYLYKVGFSLLDVGYINFNRDAYYGEFNETLDVEEINSLEKLNAEFGSNNNGNGFNSWLPAAASVQFDYNVNDYIYLNSTIVQRIPLMANTYGVERTNLLAVSARFESRFFGAAIPVSLENYSNPQMGLALRVFNLTVGSDNFLPIFFDHNELLAADIYFHLKFKLYKNPGCRERNNGSSRTRKNSRRQKRNNSFDCPTF